MAASRCPNSNCKSGSFESITKTPIGSTLQVNFIQCSRCGTVVGIQDTTINNLIYKLAEKLKINLND